MPEFCENKDYSNLMNFYRKILIQTLIEIQRETDSHQSWSMRERNWY